MEKYVVSIQFRSGNSIVICIDGGCWGPECGVYIAHHIRYYSPATITGITKDGQEYPITPLWLVKAIKEHNARS